MSLGYKAVHKRLQVHRGPASAYPCVDCGNKARDWAHRHGTDPDTLDNYDPRCRSCHFKYDDCRRVPGAKNGRALLSAEEVQQARDLYATGEYTIGRLADRFVVGKTTMHDALRGKTWQ